MGTSTEYVSELYGQCPACGLHCSQSNILINRDGRACLADFTLVTIAAGKSTDISSWTECGGTLRWMSPELLDPGLLGLEKPRPTTESDCYASGMVILEVLSGQVPFALYEHTPAVILKVMEGERPARPRGDEFTDTIWGLLELCWAHKPGDRPSAEAVLVCLEGAQSLRLPPDTSGAVELDNGQSDVTASDTGMFSPFRLRPQAHLTVPQDQRLLTVTAAPQLHHRTLPLLR